MKIFGYSDIFHNFQTNDTINFSKQVFSCKFFTHEFFLFSPPFWDFLYNHLIINDLIMGRWIFHLPIFYTIYAVFRHSCIKR